MVDICICIFGISTILSFAALTHSYLLYPRGDPLIFRHNNAMHTFIFMLNFRCFVAMNFNSSVVNNIILFGTWFIEFFLYLYYSGFYWRLNIPIFIRNIPIFIINPFTTMWPTGGPRCILSRNCIEKHFLLLFS
jgi:hypothetical protein